MLEHQGSYTVITTFQETMTMQNPSYTIQKFSEKFQKITTIKEIKSLATSIGVTFSAEISSSTVWILDWDITTGNLSGTLEISLAPKLVANGLEFTVPSQKFRIESPDLSLADLEKQFLAALKASIQKLR